MYLQNPFDNTPTDTPVTEIAFTIETNLKKMLSEAKLPVKVQTEGYYVMWDATTAWVSLSPNPQVDITS